MDERFKKLQTDPRFKKAKKDAHKVKIDERFSHMLKSSEFGTSAGIDKRGRVQNSTVAKDLKRFYKLEQEESSEEEFVADLARGEGLVESSDEEIEMESEEEQGPWADEEIPTGEETNRFAVVNLDWDHVKSKDLFKVFDGFRPPRGTIQSVRIYPSEFGKERMSMEQVQGPPSTVFEEEDTNTEGKDFNVAALRKYQVERLKYYYAVVECDSVDTARVIFKSCDGAEFESSANFFDLRYIPDGMEFDDEPRDETTDAPVLYQPADFVTQALQHSNVKLTWDAEDPERIKTTKRKFTKDDIKDMDFNAFLASESEDEVDPELAAKYKALVGGNDDEEVMQDMEITFAPGLSEKAAKRIEELKEEKERVNETVFEAQLRKQREKKKQKRLAKEQEQGTFVLLESESEHSGHGLDDSFFQEAFGEEFEQPKVVKEKSKKSKDKKKSKEAKETEAKAKAELELLLMDHQDDKQHFKARDVIKAEKAKSKKQKKKLKTAHLETQDDFKMDLNDPRFSALLEDHRFHIDPTNPQFKKTKTMQEILAVKRSKNESVFSKPTEPIKNEKADLSTLVASVKRKTEKMKSKRS